MPIPSVVIEPASSNEGDDDRDGDIISPTTISDNGVTSESQTMKHMSPAGGASGLPSDFLYKVGLPAFISPFKPKEPHERFHAWLCVCALDLGFFSPLFYRWRPCMTLRLQTQMSLN